MSEAYPKIKESVLRDLIVKDIYDRVVGSAAGTQAAALL